MLQICFVVAILVFLIPRVLVIAVAAAVRVRECVCVLPFLPFFIHLHTILSYQIYLDFACICVKECVFYSMGFGLFEVSYILYIAA